jgi:hypothetical protein
MNLVASRLIHTTTPAWAILAVFLAACGGGSAGGGSGGGVSGTANEAACASGQGMVCTDLDTDDANCGTCGRSCSSTDGCVLGACQPLQLSAGETDREDGTELADGGYGCSHGYLLCYTNVYKGVNVCVDPQADSSNCGACGNACPTGQACAYGKCTDQCPSGDALWSVPASLKSGISVNSVGSPVGQSSSTSPSTTGIPCVSESQCSGDVTLVEDGLSLSFSLTVCPGTGGSPSLCTDLSIDDANCGACGQACPDGSSCLAGTCRSSCGKYLGYCAGGQACAAFSDVCVSTCPTEFGYAETDCQGYCTILASDPANCGACGVVCPDHQACIGGSCVSGCSKSGASACANGEVCTSSGACAATCD